MITKTSGGIVGMKKKHGMPRVGRKRLITRVESEITGLSRKTFVSNTGDALHLIDARKASFYAKVKGTTTATRLLKRFWKS